MDLYVEKKYRIFGNRIAQKKRLIVIRRAGSIADLVIMDRHGHQNSWRPDNGLTTCSDLAVVAPCISRRQSDIAYYAAAKWFSLSLFPLTLYDVSFLYRYLHIHRTVVAPLFDITVSTVRSIATRISVRKSTYVVSYWRRYIYYGALISLATKTIACLGQLSIQIGICLNDVLSTGCAPI